MDSVILYNGKYTGSKQWMTRMHSPLKYVQNVEIIFRLFKSRLIFFIKTFVTAFVMLYFVCFLCLFVFSVNLTSDIQYLINSWPDYKKCLCEVRLRIHLGIRSSLSPSQFKTWTGTCSPVHCCRAVVEYSNKK